MNSSRIIDLLIGFGITSVLVTASFGCLATHDMATDDVSIDDASALTSLACNVAPSLPAQGCTDEPLGNSLAQCFYDAPELSFTDGWKCTPPGDPINGRCSTSTVGKNVAFVFITGPYSPLDPGITFTWKPSDAQGSVQVLIDGVDRGLVWQGGNSSGCKTFLLSSGLHTIRLVKPARDGDRKISIRSFLNGA
jgi:hypothetical protein